MFNAEGKRLLQEKHTGTVEEQLRSLTSERISAEIKVEQDKLGECIRLLRESIAGDGSVPISKTHQNCLKLLKVGFLVGFPFSALIHHRFRGLHGEGEGAPGQS